MISLKKFFDLAHPSGPGWRVPVLTAMSSPTSWRRTWEWASADAFLRRICDRERLKILRSEQSSLDREQKRLFEEIIRLRTFYGLKIKITPAVEAALARFAAAIS